MKRSASLVFLAVILALAGCSKGESEHNAGHQGMDMGNTKVITHGDIQVVFDLMDQAGHDAMTKSMKMDAGHMHGMTGMKADHFITVSLMKKPGNTVIKDASVELKVTGPDGKVQNSTCHTMEGEGMFHFAGEFMMMNKGMYKVAASINAEGKKFPAETEFEIK